MPVTVLSKTLLGCPVLVAGHAVFQVRIILTGSRLLIRRLLRVPRRR